jgi:hypothetical protein
VGKLDLTPEAAIPMSKVDPRTVPGGTMVD